MKDWEHLIQELGAVYRLKLYKRTGWQKHGIIHAESIAEHSFMVAYLCLLLSKNIKTQDLETESLTDFDRNRAVNMGLVHDLAESELTDLPMEFVKYFGNEKKGSLENRVYQDRFAGTVIFDLWQEFYQCRTDEAKFVHLIDWLEMVLQAYFYEKSNNIRLDEFFREREFGFKPPETFKFIFDIFTHLKSERVKRT